jgi:hypothetical protein
LLSQLQTDGRDIMGGIWESNPVLLACDRGPLRDRVLRLFAFTH